MSEEASAAPKIGRRRKLEHWKKIAALLMLYDLFVIHASYFLALWLRYDCEYTRIPSRYLTPYMRYITVPQHLALCKLYGVRPDTLCLCGGLVGLQYALDVGCAADAAVVLSLGHDPAVHADHCRPRVLPVRAP